jgi:hypothetical protein
MSSTFEHDEWSWPELIITATYDAEDVLLAWRKAKLPQPTAAIDREPFGRGKHVGLGAGCTALDIACKQCGLSKQKTLKSMRTTVGNKSIRPLQLRQRYVFCLSEAGASFTTGFSL